MNYCVTDGKCENPHETTSRLQLLRWRSNNDLRLQKFTNSSWLPITAAIFFDNGLYNVCLTLCHFVADTLCSYHGPTGVRGPQFGKPRLRYLANLLKSIKNKKVYGKLIKKISYVHALCDVLFSS